MAVEYINENDTLNTGRVKINAAIDLANQASVLANEAKTEAYSTQTQLDNIILENGQSDAEVVQARTKSDGTTFPLLKNRLDDMDAQIGEKAKQSDLVQLNDEVIQARTKADGTTFPLLKDRLNNIDVSLMEINKQLPGDKTEIIAHRGFMYSAPQNTMAAFSFAIGAGADSLETDLKITADGQVVCIHDDELSLYTTGSGKVYEKTLAEIQTYDAGVKFSPKFAGAIIPTFDEVLKFAKGKVKMIYAEIKGYRTINDIKLMVDCVKNNNMERYVCFTSFNQFELEEVRKYSDVVKIGLERETYPTADEIAFLENDPNALIIPIYSIVDANFVSDMFSRNLDIVAYNVWSFGIAQNMLNLGVTKLVLDYYYGGI